MRIKEEDRNLVKTKGFLNSQSFQVKKMFLPLSFKLLTATLIVNGMAEKKKKIVKLRLFKQL